MRNKLLLKVNHLQRRSIVPGSKNVNPRNESTHSTQVRYPHPPPPQKNKHIPENLVQQSSHRTISLDLPIDVAQEINRSLIGITIHDQCADILQEIFFLSTMIPTKLLGISHKKFLLTFHTTEDKNAVFTMLKDWFLEVRQVSHLDLIPPRLAWLNCAGLPFSLWNLENWNKILGDWGYVITRNFKNLKCGMLQTPRICIQTNQVRDIEETIKIVVENKTYWIKIK